MTSSRDLGETAGVKLETSGQGHTPGPLVAEPEQTWWNVKVVGSDRPETERDSATADYTASYCTEADARLYAAAPALLAALRRAERGLTYASIGAAKRDELAADALAARAAIAKAGASQ